VWLFETSSRILASRLTLLLSVISKTSNELKIFSTWKIFIAFSWIIQTIYLVPKPAPTFKDDSFRLKKLEVIFTRNQILLRLIYQFSNKNLSPIPGRKACINSLLKITAFRRINNVESYQISQKNINRVKELSSKGKIWTVFQETFDRKSFELNHFSSIFDLWLSISHFQRIKEKKNLKGKVNLFLYLKDMFSSLCNRFFA
jgi:hypothetical protein